MATTSPAPEILFAQHLAANVKVHRDRALRKLQKYLFNHSSLPNGGFNEAELLKIWKGLHYCMWMQDKPLIQEELSDNICNLIHSFNNSKTALLFIKTFYITECREWMSIDKWRMDKFLMMFRNMLTQSLEFLKKKNWSEKLVREFLDFISKHILLDHNHDTSPDGVRFHLADTYLTELEKVSLGQLGPKQTVTFLQPWVDMLSDIKCKTLRAYVIKNIFGEIIQNSPVLMGKPRKKGSSKLRVNYRLLADKLLEVGSSEKCRSVNRPAIYNLVQNFRDIADNKLPFTPEDESDEEEIPDLNDDDIESAVSRLTEFRQEIKQENEEEKRSLKKRKKKDINEDDEAYGSESSGDDGEHTAGTSNNNGQTSEPEPKKKKLESKVKREKGKVLSKKLQKILQAEQEFMVDEAEKDVDMNDSESGEGENECSEEEFAENGQEFGDGSDDDGEWLDEEDSEGSFSEGEDDLLYADDDDLDDFILDDGSLDETEGANDVLPLQRTSMSGKKEKKTLGKNKKIKEQDTPVQPAKPSEKEKLSKPSKKEKLSKPSEKKELSKPSEEQPKNKKSSKKGAKAVVSAEFEVADFPEAGNSLDISNFAPASIPKTNSKYKKGNVKSIRKDKNTNNNSIPEQPIPVIDDSKLIKADKNSKKIAKFIPEAGAKAKCFKKAASKVSPRLSDVQTPKSDRKRLSFGRNSSVKTSAVKLRGSVSYDPTKTPEQGILRVNPIKPGTVIHVGKQATLKNTLKNSKYPQRMMAMNFF